MADENLYQYFKIEAREIVADLSRDILGLEKEGADADLMLRLLRQAHTLKGAARVVRLPRIAEIAHAMEDSLTPYRAFVLRDIEDGRAVVEGARGLEEVGPGDVLPGGARVERIEKRGANWVVLTDRGAINPDGRWD